MNFHKKTLHMFSPEDKVFNILHVISKLPVGGVENMLLKVVQGYNKKRFNVSVCCIKEGGGIAEELELLGYKVHILNKMKGHGFDLSAVFAIYNLLERENIHILRTHQYHANLYGRIAGKLAGVPVIIPSIHNLYNVPNKPKFHRRVFDYLLGFFSDALIAVSNTVASDIIRYDKVNPKKIKVIYNGIVIEKFNSKISRQEARDVLNLPHNSTIIGTVGRLTEQKGHRYLIEAASKLGDICVAIVGDGLLKEDVINFANRLQINCIFMGQLSPEKIPFFLNSLDIFCFPSLWEGFGTAVVEAMAAGLPVIASDIPPHREVVSDAGILAAPGDAKAFVEAIKRIINDPSLRDALGKKARERSHSFSIENTVKNYENLFEEILKKKALL